MSLVAQIASLHRQRVALDRALAAPREREKREKRGKHDRPHQLPHDGKSADGGGFEPERARSEIERSRLETADAGYLVVGEAPLGSDEPRGVVCGARRSGGVADLAVVDRSAARFEFGKRRIERLRREDLRQEPVSGLLARLPEQRAPALRMVAVGDRARAEQRPDLAHAEFGGLLEQ